MGWEVEFFFLFWISRGNGPGGGAGEGYRLVKLQYRQMCARISKVDFSTSQS